MNCEKFTSLSEHDQAVYLAKVNHCLRSDSSLFEMGNMIICLGEKRGLFNGVSIGNDEVRNAILEYENSTE